MSDTHRTSDGSIAYDTGGLLTGAFIELRVTPTEGGSPVAVAPTSADVELDPPSGRLEMELLIDENLAGLRALDIYDDDGRPSGGGPYHRVSLTVYASEAEDARELAEYAIYDAHREHNPVIFPMEEAAIMPLAFFPDPKTGSHGFENFGGGDE